MLLILDISSILNFQNNKNNFNCLSVHLFQFKNHYANNTQPLELIKHIRVPINVNI